MNWDEKQKRWRAMYRRRRLQVRASDLVIGATTYAETVLAANQWFRKQQEWIDRELAVGTHRPHEEDYLAELDSIQSALKALPVLAHSNPALQSMLVPEVAKLKHKEVLIRQALRQEVLPPLNDTLRNPLNVSPEGVESAAFKEATQQIVDQMRVGNPFEVSLEELQNTEGYEQYDPQVHCDLSDFDSEDNMDVVYSGKRGVSLNDNNRKIARRVREDRLQEQAGNVAALKDKVLARKKQETGTIDEFARGIITQLLNDHGANVPESKRLDYHIGKFLEYHHRRFVLRKITAGRFGKIVNTIKRYQEWTKKTGITSVDKIGTREHIADYFKRLEDLVIDKIIKPEYANNLFGTFKMLIGWLSDIEVLKEYPRCLQRKNKDFMFRVDRQRPVTVPLEWVRRILDDASPRLKLCLLLTLNCGFGASEIGQLQKSEYDPATGRITHKRCKTKDAPNAPTVCYKLWNITKELMDRAIAERSKYPQLLPCAKFLLVNSSGKPLWYEYVEDGKSSKSDNISCDFRRLIAKLRKVDPDIPAISYYQFRKTSASLIYNEPKYRIYNGLWLAHSPRSVADRHYNDPDGTILDETILWLHDKIFGLEEAEMLK